MTQSARGALGMHVTFIVVGSFRLKMPVTIFAVQSMYYSDFLESKKCDSASNILKMC